MHVPALLAALLVAAAPVRAAEGVTAATGDVASDIRAANELEARGDHDGAIRQYDQLLRRELPPVERAVAYLGRGVAHGEKRELDASIDDLTQAIRIAPRFWKAWYMRALSHFNKADYPSAIADFDAMAEGAADFPYYHRYRGLAKLENRDYAGAIADLDQAMSGPGVDATVYYWRGRAHAALDHAGLAAADFAEAVARKSADPSIPLSALRWQGTLAFAEKRYDAAIGFFRRLQQQSESGDADAAMRLANAQYAKGDDAAVVESLATVIRPEADTGAVFPWPGVVAPERPFADRIVDQYNSGMRLPGSDPYAFVLRARAERRLGQRDAAIADYRRALALIPAGADPAVTAELEQARR